MRMTTSPAGGSGPDPAPGRSPELAALYDSAYRGRVPWQRAAAPRELAALVEGPDALPPGRSLDLGCGTGTDVLYLAERGWDAVGVDAAAGAIAQARGRAVERGVDAVFVQGDVTRLPELGIHDGFGLVTDFNCFHTIPRDARVRYVASVSAVARPGAELLMYTFLEADGETTPLSIGVAEGEVERLFPPAGWHLVEAHEAPPDRLSPAERRYAARFGFRFYRLRR